MRKPKGKPALRLLLWRAATTAKSKHHSLLVELTDASRVKGNLVVKEVIADAISFLSGVNGGADFTETASQGFLLGAGNGRDVLSSMEAHQVESIAESALALLGDLADAAKIATFIGHQIITGKGPDFLGVEKALGMTQVGQITAGQKMTKAGHRGQDRGGRVRDEALGPVLDAVKMGFQSQKPLKIELQLVGQEFGHVAGGQNGVLDDIEGQISGDRAAATNVSAQEILDPVHP